jgi:hypothetical protein
MMTDPARKVVSPSDRTCTAGGRCTGGKEGRQISERRVNLLIGLGTGALANEDPSNRARLYGWRRGPGREDGGDVRLVKQRVLVHLGGHCPNSGDPPDADRSATSVQEEVSSAQSHMSPSHSTFTDEGAAVGVVHRMGFFPSIMWRHAWSTTCPRVTAGPDANLDRT